MIYFKLYFGESTLFYFCYSIFFDKKDLREMFWHAEHWTFSQESREDSTTAKFYWENWR